MVTGDEPPAEIDHKNGAGNDNRWVNLRPATSHQNKCNSKLRSDSKIGLKGVQSWRNRFRAYICIEGKRVGLGVFLTKEQAHAAYCEAARQEFGEFWSSGS